MTAWAIETAIASTILMLVVLAIRGPVARYFGPHIAYGLWLLPALRLLLPPLPEAVAPAPLQMLPAAIDIEALLMAPVPMVASIEPSLDWPLLMLGLWGAGAASFLAWHLYCYWRFVETAIGTATQLPRLDRDGVEVCASPVAGAPFAAGIFMKAIVLPEDYRKRYEKDELRLAIEHEIQHHRRGDMSANLVALVVLALHWWNPIAHWAHRAFRVDQELACDAVVLAAATPAERHAYGSALLKSACDRLPVAACALGAGDDLKRRLKMMRLYRWNPARARVGSLIAAGLVGGGLLLTASNGIAAETTEKVEERVRTVLAPVVPALAPEAPPAPLAPLAEPARIELAMVHPHPEPLPPVAAVPPVPPLPPMPNVHVEIDHDEISREVREAMTEARREMAEARREAEQERQEALREAEQDRREALQQAEEARREGHRDREDARTRSRADAPDVAARARAEAARARAQTKGAMATCKDSRAVMIQVSKSNDRSAVRCLGWSDKETAEFRRTMIAGLQNARVSIASMDRRHMAEHAREQALASIDRQIQQLRKGE